MLELQVKATWVKQLNFSIEVVEMAQGLLSELRQAVELYDSLPDAIICMKYKIAATLDWLFSCTSSEPLTWNYQTLDGRKLNTEDVDEAMAAKTPSVWVVESELGQVENPLQHKIYLTSSSSCTIICVAVQTLCQNKGYIKLGRLGRAEVLDINILSGMWVNLIACS